MKNFFSLISVLFSFQCSLLTHGHIKEYKEITQRLCSVILTSDNAFLDDLYNSEDYKGELQEALKFKKEMFYMIISKLKEIYKPKSCLVLKEEKREGNYVIHLLFNKITEIEFYVDDVYEKGGYIYLLDEIKIKLIKDK